MRNGSKSKKRTGRSKLGRNMQHKKSNMSMRVTFSMRKNSEQKGPEGDKK